MDEMSLQRIASTAVKDSKMIRIEYEDNRGVVTDRRVEPYEIKNSRLFAYSIDPGSQGVPGIRQFKIFQIIKAEVIEETFVPRWPVQIYAVEPDIVEQPTEAGPVETFVEKGPMASLKDEGENNAE